MKNFSKDSKEYATEIINYEKKKKKNDTTYEENKSYKNQKVCYTYKK